MRCRDISLELSPQTVRWVSSPPFELIERRRMSRGERNNSSVVKMSVHAGSHVDAPFHFVAEGQTIESLPLELFIGPARVVAVDAERTIRADHIEPLDLEGETRVLFKTRNSRLLRQPYTPDFVAFSVEAARALVARGIRLVGLDYLSVAHEEDQVPVHRAFLENGVVLLEGIDLSAIEPGRYELICLPLKLRGADGAPCRAVLRELAPAA